MVRGRGADHVVQAAGAPPCRGERIWRTLKASPDVDDRERRTLFDLLSDASEKGLGTALADRAAGGASDPFQAPGSGLTPTAAGGGKVLSHPDLRAAAPLCPDREATREVEPRPTGTLERGIWSIDGVKYEDALPSARNTASGCASVSSPRR